MMKREFNPARKRDRDLYRQYLMHGGWGGSCPFVAEVPYLSVPDTINNKLVRYWLRVPNVHER